MKEMNLLIWLTQLGLSLIIPLVSFVLLGLWLHHSLGWGRWALIAGIVLGVITGIQSLLSALKIMSGMDRTKKEEHPRSFNHHS